MRVKSKITFFLKCSISNISMMVLVLCVRNSDCVRRQFEIAPDIPSHLPSPPEPVAAPANPGTAGGVSSTNAGGGGGPGNFGGSGPFGFFADVPPVPPPQNVPVGPVPGAGIPEEDVPFGLKHIILIIVPQFKTKFRRLPGWIHSSVKVSMPITVFFDKLTLGPALSPGLIPGIGPVGPPGTNPMLNETLMAAGLAGQYAYPGLYPYMNLEEEEEEDDENEYESEEDDDDDLYEGYYAEEKQSNRRRRKRYVTSSQFEPDNHSSKPLLLDFENTVPKYGRKRSVPFNRTIHSAERATLLPRLENMLESGGLGGKSCLLRAICEVHEAPLHHYGLLGELFTMFFSVSRSMYAESHLPEYLRAERIGKSGDCSEFHEDCDKTLFSWV